ncbi:hypothetical protein C8R43DRAFT_845397, partial [Mycena crocata]
VYTHQRGIPSKSPTDAQKPFIGRIPARSVPPPHNVDSLKRCIAGTENLSYAGGTRTSLYLSPGALSAMDTTAKVVI